MAPAEGDAALSGRRRGRRPRGWVAFLCFGSRGAPGEEKFVAGTTWARRKRTVPVDGEEAAAAAAGKGGCCFLPPARVPGRKDGNLEFDGRGGSETNHKHERKRKQARPQDDRNQPSKAPDARARQVQTRVAPATTGAADERAPTRDAATKSKASARECSVAAAGSIGHGTTAGGVGAFGPAVGLSVVAAVSMAGLLSGRLWAVACVCAWLVGLSRLRRRHRHAQVTAGGDVGEVAVPP